MNSFFSTDAILVIPDASTSLLWQEADMKKNTPVHLPWQEMRVIL